ncbi:MAG: PIN domain-containing protein [Syntrophomonadaceae bacterium]|jgi:hypothetical protein
MCKKRAFVFDTNFIIENLNLKEVVANLSEDFTVYVTQVSIDERISQKYMELKKKYEKLTEFTDEYRGIAAICITTLFDKKFEAEKELTQNGYIELFGEHIIPFSSNDATFSKILDRVFKKVPPFLSFDGASDKGFKDSLIWLSLLEFFQSNGEDDIIFITNDNGFRKNTDALCKEFSEFTGKSIVIKDNSYYKSLFESKVSETIPPKKGSPLLDVNQFREKIHDIIYSLCGVYDEDYWGNPNWTRTFTLNQRVDSAYMEYVFTHLKQDIRDNLFETAISAEKVLGLDDRVTSEIPIPLSALEDALSLYEEIQQKLPDYLQQFYSAAATIMNTNYIEPQVIDVEDDEIPF